MQNRKNILIFGMDSVSLSLGVHFLKSNQNVTFISTNEIIYNLFKQNNLITQGECGEDSYKLSVKSSPQNINIQDLILIFSKNSEIETITKNLKPLIYQKTNIISFTKGIDGEEKIKSTLGNKLLGGISYINSTLQENILDIKQIKETILGEINSSPTNRMKEIFDFFNSCGILTRLTDDFKTEKWIKFVWTNAFDSLSFIEKKTVSELISTPETRTTLVKLMAETINVGNKIAGIIFPDNLISTQLKNFLNSNIKENIQDNSFLEYEFLNEYIVKLAEKSGLNVPENIKICNQIE